MDANDAGKEHNDADVETLQALSCLLLLEVQHWVFTRREVSIDDLWHQLAHFEQLIAVEPVCEMPAELGTTHEHQCLGVVENPRFAEVEVGVKGLPSEDKSDQQVRHQQYLQYPMHKPWLRLLPLVEFKVP